MESKKQKRLTESYFMELEYRIPENLNRYKQGTMELDESKTVYLNNVLEPQGLTKEFNALKGSNKDLEAGKLLFEAFPNIDGAIAADICFWTYITHTCMYRYLYNRLSMMKNIRETTADDIKKLYFKRADSRLVESYAPSLYQLVSLTHDKNRSNPYELTELLFRFSPNLRIQLLKNRIFRNREPLQGLLEYVLQNQRVMIPGLTRDYKDTANIPFNQIKILFETIGVNQDISFYRKEDYFHLIKNYLDD